MTHAWDVPARYVLVLKVAVKVPNHICAPDCLCWSRKRRKK